MLSPHALARLLAAAAGLVLVLTSPTAAAAGSAQKPDPQAKLEYSGISLYRNYCAVCHGVEAKGNGPLADQLRFRPPDLTVIAKHNRGKYPAERVFRMIDGREMVKGHGGPDMPVWGDAFKSTSEGYSDEAVKAKIQALVDYLAGVQERADPE